MQANDYKKGGPYPEADPLPENSFTTAIRLAELRLQSVFKPVELTLPILNLHEFLLLTAFHKK
jgi:hypothetical protein